MMRLTYYFIQLSRPLLILGAILLYSIGAGVVRFLGIGVNWGVFVLGLLWAIALQLATNYLTEYYNTSTDQENPHRTPFFISSSAIGEGKLSQHVPLIAALTSLAFLTSFTVLILSNVKPEPIVFLIMGLSFIGSILFSLPPIRLESSGYGELITSVVVAFFLPSFAFALQMGEIQRFIPMTAFPLTLIHLAMMITFEFPDYATDIKFNKQTMLTRMGWQNGMNFQNFLVISAYILSLLMFWLGLPRIVVLHGFLSLPFALFQLWLFWRIRQGTKPNWTVLSFSSLATFGTMTYFIALAYWTR